MEQRFSPLQAQTDGRRVFGHAILWGVPSNVVGVGPELFEKGSLQIPSSGCSLYFQHDRTNLLANTKSGTMKIWEDDLG